MAGRWAHPVSQRMTNVGWEEHLFLSLTSLPTLGVQWDQFVEDNAVTKCEW